MASLFTTGFVLLVVYCGSSLSLACDPAAQSDTECSGSEEEPVPVCATFTKNFASACALEAELCRLAKDGFHHVEKRDGDCCQGPMPLLWAPTCASDGKTYGNQWDMGYAACRNKDYLTEADPHTCPDFPEEALMPVS